MEPLAQYGGNSLQVDVIFCNQHIPMVSGCIDKIRRLEVRKHSVKNAGKFKMAPVNFGAAEEFFVRKW